MHYQEGGVKVRITNTTIITVSPEDRVKLASRHKEGKTQSEKKTSQVDSFQVSTANFYFSRLHSTYAVVMETFLAPVISYL